MHFQPIGNRVLVRRLPAQSGLIDMSACDEKAGGGMILVEGEIISVGPGKWVSGEWWKLGKNQECPEHPGWPRHCICEWEWVPGHLQPCNVYPGQKVIFNARWNDFTAGELVGSDSDGKGPLERPMPQWQWGQRDLHLITEGDIAGILNA